MLVCLLVGSSGSAVNGVSVGLLSAVCFGVAVGSCVCAVFGSRVATSAFASLVSGGGVRRVKYADAPASSLVISCVLSAFFIGEKFRQSVCHMLGQILP